MTTNSVSQFSLGDLVTTKSHPFFEKQNSEVSIKARAEFTPPILNIFDINIPEYFNENTGEKLISYHCMYYDTRVGEFESKWFSHAELKLISKNNIKDNKETYLDSSKVNLDQLKNKLCILKSVDVELSRLKINFVTTNFKSDIKKSAHLDFLPPVLEILEVTKNNSDKNFNKNTGVRTKSSKQVKAKWFNPVKNTYSEKVLPISILKSVGTTNDSTTELLQKDIIGNYYCYKSGTNPVIASVTEVSYNHYYYQVYGRNILSNKIELLEIDKIKKENLYTLHQRKSEQNQEVQKSIYSSDVVPRIENKEYIPLDSQYFEVENYYHITYKDNLGVITNRVAKVTDIFDLTIEEKPQKGKEPATKNTTFIEVECYLRGKQKRNLNFDNIIKAYQVNSELLS